MTAIIIRDTETELVPGKAYLVKHRGGQKFTRRIFRGTEEGVLEMQRLVFTAKVKKNVYVIVEEVKDKDGNANGVTFWQWKNTQTVPAQDISIPYFDVLEVKPVN